MKKLSCRIILEALNWCCLNEDNRDNKAKKDTRSNTLPKKSPCIQPISEFNSFKVDERPGEQWIRLSRKFGEHEEIKIEVTMFDGSVPMKMNDDKEDLKLRVTLIVDVVKGKDSDILEFVCSGWPDGIEIRNVFTRGHDGIKDQPYMGPKFQYVVHSF